MQDTEVLERAEPVATVSPYERPAEGVFVEEGEDEEEDAVGWSGEYDISVIPNDFNVSTLCNYMERGTIIIPRFQRDFVWTKRIASRFIQSVALGLPVPELFLYEARRKSWWVVDGQQRLLSLYLFRKDRFPKDKFGLGRLLRDGAETIAPVAWNDPGKFSRFNLDLKLPDGREDLLHGRSYEELEVDEAFEFDARPLRVIVVRQHNPNGYNAAYEIFNRLNTGGVRLSPQQIRECVYESPFLRMVDALNNSEEWRRLFSRDGRHDLKRADAQAIARAFAMLSKGEEYAPGMARFLNDFCREMQKLPADDERLEFMRTLFKGFLRACAASDQIFREDRGFRFSLFDAVFAASLGRCFQERRIPDGRLDPEAVKRLEQDAAYAETVRQSSTTAANVRKRLEIARQIIRPL